MGASHKLKSFSRTLAQISDLSFFHGKFVPWENLTHNLATKTRFARLTSSIRRHQGDPDDPARPVFLVAPVRDAVTTYGAVRSRREHRPRDKHGDPTPSRRNQVPILERRRRRIAPTATIVAHLRRRETAAHRKGVRVGASRRRRTRL